MPTVLCQPCQLFQLVFATFERDDRLPFFVPNHIICVYVCLTLNKFLTYSFPRGMGSFFENLSIFPKVRKYLKLGPGGGWV